MESVSPIELPTGQMSSGVAPIGHVHGSMPVQVPAEKVQAVIAVHQPLEVAWIDDRGAEAPGHRDGADDAGDGRHDPRLALERTE